jgi:putative ABC transport system permease protein
MRQIRISLRSLKKSPMLVYINLPGLIIGLSAVILLLTYLKHEWSYDKHFNDKDQIFRLYNQAQFENSTNTYPICLRKAYIDIPQQVPEIDYACQFYRGYSFNSKYQDKSYRGSNSLFVDSSFFDVFGLSLIKGNESSALALENQVVITTEMAMVLFGDEEALNKTIKVDGKDYLVSGIMDRLPDNTHFNFDMLYSMSSLFGPGIYLGSLEYFTYFKLNKHCDFTQTTEQICSINTKILKDHFPDYALDYISGLENITDIHLKTKADFDLGRMGDIKLVRLITILSILILIIALINFVNLYIFYGEKRVMEIGMRKSFGATQSNLKGLFYSETALLMSFAMIVAILISYAFMDKFSELIQLQLHINDLIDLKGIVILILFLAIIILISGFYPAKYLSGLKLIDSIRGTGINLIRNKWLIIISVLTQFFISILLIFSLFIIRDQVNYLKSYPIGFNKTDVICISGFEKNIEPKMEAIQDELSKFPFISNICSSSHYMGGGVSGQMVSIYGHTSENRSEINEYRVQAGFCETMKLQLVEGRFFKPGEADYHTILLNETAVKNLGLEDPLNHSLSMFESMPPLKIIGVVKDFVYNENSGKKIEGLCLTNYARRSFALYVRTQGGHISNHRKLIGNTLESIIPEYQYKDQMLDQVYEMKYIEENRTYSLILNGTILALILSFVGMFALSFYNVEKRSKEIGIRKVHGSTNNQIFYRLWKDIIKWIFFAMIPSFITGWFILNSFLNNYENHIHIELKHFIVAGIFSILIASLAIFLKSYQASRQNPVKNLKYE